MGRFQKSESQILERVTGVEPVSLDWQPNVIAIILYPLIVNFQFTIFNFQTIPNSKIWKFINDLFKRLLCGTSRIRTYDQTIMSRPLYH